VECRCGVANIAAWCRLLKQPIPRGALRRRGFRRGRLAGVAGVRLGVSINSAVKTAEPFFLLASCRCSDARRTCIGQRRGRPSCTAYSVGRALCLFAARVLVARESPRPSGGLEWEGAAATESTAIAAGPHDSDAPVTSKARRRRSFLLEHDLSENRFPLFGIMPCRDVDRNRGNDARRYGTTARKRNAAKITRCTIPCSTVVRPVPKVITPTRSVSASRTSSITFSPSSSG
jgi:hypothetical protein